MAGQSAEAAQEAEACYASGIRLKARYLGASAILHASKEDVDELADRLQQVRRDGAWSKRVDTVKHEPSPRFNVCVA